jgi:hypothetical protein
MQLYWWELMPNRAQKFRMHEVRRGLLAAKAAGVADPIVRVHCPDGTVFAIGSAGDKPTAPDRPVPAAAPRKARK